MTLFLLLACAGPDKGDSMPSETDTDTDTDADTDADTDTDTDTDADTDRPPADADGDGWPVGTDCDDENAAVHPEAQETWYDGVDADCLGDDDDDQDGDGHSAIARGGDDCDDTMRTVYPGATEQCDPVDHDCDGDPLPAGVCAQVQDARLLGRDISRYSWGHMGLISDLTGDGVADLVSQNQYWLPGTVVWRATDPVPARAGVFPDSTFASWYEGSGANTGPLDAGDVNGDGYNDLAIAYNQTPFGIALFYGPIADDGRVLDAEAPDAWWREECPDIYSSCHHENVFADFDGDGLNDALTLVYAKKGGGTYVFYGDGGSAWLGAGWLADLYGPGDLDGDGHPEVIGDWSILDGAALAEGRVDVRAELEYGEGMQPYFWGRLPDLDGDGVEELVYSGATHRDDTWEMLFFQPGVAGMFGLADALGGYRRLDDEVYGGAVRPCNAFGDGGTSVFGLDSEAGVGGLEIFQLPGTIPPRGTILPSRSVRIEGNVGSVSHSNCADVTGDGRDDIAFQKYEDVDDDPGDRALMLVPGFELDWEDDTLWDTGI
ncbi:MAG: MopE-related protein [Myxococcota bacterium]